MPLMAASDSEDRQQDDPSYDSASDIQDQTGTDRSNRTSNQGKQSCLNTDGKSAPQCNDCPSKCYFLHNKNSFALPGTPPSCLECREGRISCFSFFILAPAPHELNREQKVIWI